MRRVLFVSMLLLVPACGGSGGKAPDATFEHPLLVRENLYGGPAPDDAAVVTAQELVALVESGTHSLITATDREAELAALRQETETNRAAAVNRYGNEPELLARMIRAVQPGDPDAKAEPDGSFLFRGIPEDPQAGTPAEWFRLDGTRFSDKELVVAKEQYEQRDTQRALYAHLYEQVPGGVRQQFSLPAPAQVEDEDFEFFHELNQEVGSHWEILEPLPTPQPPPPGYPDSWRDELGVRAVGGSARGLDRRGPERQPSGLWTHVDFPLKYCATRVRSQGARGTGVHFAVTGAIEARVAAQYGRYVNLSEQFMVNQEILSRPRLIAVPPPLGVPRATAIGEGAAVDAVLAFLQTSGFVYPYEHRWDYNPSWYRLYHDGDLYLAPSYSRSCWASATGAPYPGRFCSDTNHQSPMVCSDASWVGPLPVLPGEARVLCATRDPTEVERDSGISLHSASVVAHYERRDLNHDVIKTLLIGKVPIVYSFAVPRRTMTAPAGIVPFDPTDTEIVGAHAVVILGYVDNADLRPGFPTGSGGGYYIIKNSWGTGFGDAGYMYAPVDWVGKYLISMHAILGVNG